MWLIGAVIGLFLGNLISPSGGLVGLLCGGAIGWWLKNKDKAGTNLTGGLTGGLTRGPGTDTSGATPDLHARVARLEAQVTALETELSVLRGSGPLPTNAATPTAAATPDRTSEAVPVAPRTLGADVAMPAPLAPAAGTSSAVPPEAVAAATHAPPAAMVAHAALPPEPDLPPATPIEIPAWAKRLWEGNPLAKIGIVLLFFGIASGLKLAIDYGVFPVPVRLALAAALGLALIGFGVNRVRQPERPEHRTFGLALQGGGFALLYLTGYFMLARYALVGNEVAFGLFAVLGVVCVLMAARQNDAALAVLGLSGAFLAPVLAGNRADSPLGLFLYFTLLNALIVAVDWFKAWRVLNVAGFLLTLAVGMAWATQGYEPRHYAVTEFFLALFIALYSAMPVATALLRASGAPGWLGGMLLFGTPLAGIFLQARLMRGIEYGMAWSALVAALWYFALWAALFARGRRMGEAEGTPAAAGLTLLERSHLSIALAFVTLAVPLAFGAQITSAFWAAEGCAVLWYGVRMRRRLAQATGLAMQLLAGLALMEGWERLHHGAPVANNAMLGAFIVTVAGLLAAWLLRRGAAAEAAAGEPLGMPADPSATARPRWLVSLPRALPIPPILPFLWAALWWLCAGLAEIERCVPEGEHAPAGLLFVTASMVLLEGLARLWRWPALRHGTVLLLFAALLASGLTHDRHDHPFAGLMALALPLAFIVHYALLRLQERVPPVSLPRVRHLGAYWLLLAVVPSEIAWQAGRVAPGVALWAYAAWVLLLALGTAMPVWARGRLWPFNSSQGGYLPAGAALPAVVLAVLIATANLTLSGDTGALALPYLPVLNVFDLVTLAGLLALLALTGALSDEARPATRTTLVLLAFVWISALAARIAHFWGGVPFEADELFNSTLFQSLLTVIWTIAAIATMIVASRRAQRGVWFGGFTLLGGVGAKLLIVDASGRGTLTWTATLLGVAVLVLAAGYFAPVPPRRQTRAPNGVDNAPQSLASMPPERKD